MPVSFNATNRTILELKQGKYDVIGASDGPTNRTILELKHCSPGTDQTPDQTTNRTILELKLYEFSIFINI